MAEMNFVLKYDQYSNLKGIISVRKKKKKLLASFQRATRGCIEQNITNACFFKAIKNTTPFEKSA